MDGTTQGKVRDISKERERELQGLEVRLLLIGQGSGWNEAPARSEIGPLFVPRRKSPDESRAATYPHTAIFPYGPLFFRLLRFINRPSSIEISRRLLACHEKRRTGGVALGPGPGPAPVGSSSP